MQKEIAMRTHTQFKIFFAAVLIALTTLTTITAPTRVMGAGQSKTTLDASHFVQPLHPGLPGVGRSEGAAGSRLETMRRNTSAMTTASSVTFLPVVTYYTGGLSSSSVVVADVNGDGRPDAIVTNFLSSTLGVLLGNGDGTFQPAATYNSGGADAFSVAVKDVNSDGKPDLLVVNFLSNTVGVLLGNGDGSFQPARTYDSGGVNPSSVAVADANGDG